MAAPFLVQITLPCMPQDCQVLLASQETPPNTRLTAEVGWVRAVIGSVGGEKGGEGAAFGLEEAPGSALAIVIEENICFTSVNPTIRSCWVSRDCCRVKL